MTTINLSMAGLPLSQEDEAVLADRITEAFANVEVGIDSSLIRTGFLLKFEEVNEDDLWIGSQRAVSASPSKRAALVTVRVMAGPWTKEMKAELFGRVETILREVAKMPKSGNGSVYIWIDSEKTIRSRASAGNK